MIPIHHLRKDIPLGFVLVVSLVTSACGESKGKLEGVVTYRGKPVAGGTVLIVGTDKQNPIRSPLDAEGHYTATGIPLGSAKLAVLVPLPQPLPPLPKNADPKSLPSQAPPSTSIPQKYMDPETSGLNCTITSGSQKFDIDLK